MTSAFYKDWLKSLNAEEQKKFAGILQKSPDEIQKILKKQFLGKFKMRCTITQDHLNITLESDNKPSRQITVRSRIRPVNEYVSACVKIFKISNCELHLHDTFKTYKDVMEILKDCKVSNVTAWETRKEKTNPETFLDLFGNVPEVSIQNLNWVGGVIHRPKAVPFEFKKLYVANGTWVSIKHLTETLIDCEEVLLRECVLSNLEARSFLKRWIVGSRMRKIFIGYSRFNLKTIMKNLPATPFIGTICVDYKDYKMSEGQCYIIQQNNGRRAAVFQNDDKYFLGLSTKFKSRAY
ncbi:hypothetical protein B9Z55_000228 [Caenorhabditis nigoni]|uniref:Sdz-33 F-box domain-containing protein n=1 Tax=Caenorhabditis nigoni TaxID=1611254 RepID=A0A2G5VJR6_9PELO|nr:hypothetical protein B9Z55_000228 [Caenorhabditis nigoni]